MDTATTIMDALRDVYDPCCEDRQLSVVDMGLIEDIHVDDDRAAIDLVLTSGWCPFMVPLVDTIRDRISALPSVADVDVRLVWDTAWTSDRLTPLARERLEFLPPPNATAGGDPVPMTAGSSPTSPTDHEVTP
jgi:metal-sulfur cluster biosynthetic enzyme